MSFNDIFTRTFREGFANTDLGFMEIILVFALAVCIGGYIFLVYRFITKQTFYSKHFNISLAVLPVIVAAIILAVQSSIVISLGMVGALSIVRFRTAIKDPIDLMFLFWSISAGIICGAGLGEIAVIASLIITAMVVALDNIQIVRAPMLLVLNVDNLDTEDEILKIVNAHCKYSKVKSRNVTKDRLHMIIELRTDKGTALLKELSAKEGIFSVTLMEHDGEAVC